MSGSEKSDRVAPRVRIMGLHRIAFQPGSGTGVIQVNNISSSGVGFRRDSAASWPEPSAVLAGKLAIGNESVALQARVVHATPQIIGCRYEGDTSALQKLIENYFRVELAALRGRPMNPMILKKDPRGTPHWFVADNNSELYYIENAGKLVHFRMSVFGNYMDGGDGQPVTYGFESPDSVSGELRKGSVLIQTTTELPPDVVQNAVRFLENIQSLPQEIRTKLLSWISG